MSILEPYQEQLFTLKNNEIVLMRQIAPHDREMLREGFERLSPATIRKRFMGLRRGFTEDELIFLTEIDGVDHFAIGVATINSPQGIAVGRYVRDANSSHKAELALVIVDSHQGLGLGKKLLHDLIERATKSGLHELYGNTGPDNQSMRYLLKKFKGTTIDKDIFNIRLKD
jgi:GNAT superfamily N-acetyltransferase